MSFVDITKASNSVNRQALIAILKECGVPGDWLTSTRDCMLEPGARGQMGGVSPSFEVKSGVRQGCVLSPLLFNCVMDKVLREAMAWLGGRPAH